MLTGIKDGFEARGIAVKCLFSMRDPVSRIRSHLKMEIAKGRISQDSEVDALTSFYAGPEAAARMRYDITLQEMKKAFTNGQCYTTIFEKMFQAEEITKFARWAGVAADPDAGAKRVNARGSGQSPLPASLEETIAKHYRPVYEAAAQAHPEVIDLWRSARHVL